MTKSDARKLCRALVDQAIENERKINVHLDHPEDYCMGSLAVSVRWDILAKALGYEPKSTDGGDS